MVPDDYRSPVMTHIYCLFESQGIQQAVVIIGQMMDIIFIDIVWFAGSAITSLVRYDAMITRID